VYAELERKHVVKFHRRDAAKASYPAPLVTPPKSSLPQAWIDSLEALQKAGKIPDIPVSTQSDAAGDVKYPGKLGYDDNTVCSWTITGCFGKNDLHESPDKTWVISFDDGPTSVSSGLYDYLYAKKQAGTHFMIGSQILQYKDAAIHASQTKQQLAVHTWAHTLQTTKDNYEVLGELGWTMQIIYDLTGRVPNVWRPPQGDIDNRVRAIAEGVFNLTAVMWDAECNDWCIGDDGKSACPGEKPGQSQKSVKKAINKALKRPKSPGVMLLEHELNKYTVGFFEAYYPKLKKLGWKPKSVADAFTLPWYHNAKSYNDAPVAVNSMVYSDIATTVASTTGRMATFSNTTNPGASSSAVLSASHTSDAVALPIPLSLALFASVFFLSASLTAWI
jgi:peptidoglycan/xylan/chitin deacetylase (PgdA/CDA1 family)